MFGVVYNCFCKPFRQGYTNFTKILEPPQNPRHPKGDMSKDKKILEATTQNLVTTTWHPGFVHSWQGMGVWAMIARE